MWWSKTKTPAVQVPFSSTSMLPPFSPPARPGRWRFSRWDGRMVFDYDEGPVGFGSDRWCDLDTFAAYTTWLETWGVWLSPASDLVRLTPELFTLEVPEHTPQETLEAIAKTWADRFGAAGYTLAVVPSGFDLSRVTDEELAKLGLARVS